MGLVNLPSRAKREGEGVLANLLPRAKRESQGVSVTLPPRAKIFCASIHDENVALVEKLALPKNIMNNMTSEILKRYFWKSLGPFKVP